MALSLDPIFLDIMTRISPAHSLKKVAKNDDKQCKGKFASTGVLATRRI
jgi:hypothetical protein